MLNSITLTTTLPNNFKFYYINSLLIVLDKYPKRLENAVNILKDLNRVKTNRPVLRVLRADLTALKKVNDIDTQDNKKFGPTIDSLLEKVTLLLNNL